MNTLISILMAIVLNFLGVEMQERKNATQPENTMELQINNEVHCADSTAYTLQQPCSSTRLNE